MTSTQCRVCAHGPELLDWSLPNTALAAIVDCSEASVRRHKKHSEDPDLVVGPESRFETREDGYWEPSKRWTRANGEMGFSERFVPKAVDVEMLDYSSLEASLDGFEVEPVDDLTGKPEFFIWADPQIGKAGEKGGGTQETINRTFKALNAFLHRIEKSKPSVVYVVDLGDGIENCFSTGSEIGTNDLTVPDQVLTYERLTVEIIKNILRYGCRVIHVTVTSNHGEARNAQKNNPYGSENDWGLHMQQVVKDRFSEHPELMVEFVRPDNLEDTSVIETADGTKIAFAHGHHAGSPKNVKAWVEGQVVGQCPGWDADMWVLGHFHHDYRHSFGKHKTIMGAPSCDPGSAWVTRRKGETALPGVLAFTAADHGWANYSIL